MNETRQEAVPSEIEILAAALADMAQQIGNQAQAINRLVDYLVASEVEEGGEASPMTYMSGAPR